MIAENGRFSAETGGLESLLVSEKHGLKPRRSRKFFQASISVIALIAVYL